MKNGRLEPSDHGRRFSALINDVEAKGKICYEEDKYYLCQNVKSGSTCDNMLGYNCSWIVEPDFSDYTALQVKDFKFIGMTKSEIENYRDFKKGDKIKHPSFSCKRVIIEELGEVLFTKDLDKTSAIRLFSSTEMYSNGWRLDVEPEEEEKPVVELSVAEIAKKLGLSPEQLKVVDK